MLFRVPRSKGHPDSLTIFVSHPVVPFQQVLHRENQKIWTMLPDLYQGLFIELNVMVLHQRFKTEINENWDEKFSIYLSINIYLKVLEKIY